MPCSFQQPPTQNFIAGNLKIVLSREPLHSQRAPTYLGQHFHNPKDESPEPQQSLVVTLKLVSGRWALVLRLREMAQACAVIFLGLAARQSLWSSLGCPLNLGKAPFRGPPRLKPGNLPGRVSKEQGANTWRIVKVDSYPQI